MKITVRQQERARGMTRVSQFEVRQSDDIVKTDLELTCTECGVSVCDVEDGDQLRILISMAEDHVCGVDP